MVANSFDEGPTWKPAEQIVVAQHLPTLTRSSMAESTLLSSSTPPGMQQYGFPNVLINHPVVLVL